MSDTDIHSCGYYCDRPACIKVQRDELRDKLFEIRTSEKNIQNSDNQTAESAQPWVKTYSGGKPNYTQPEETFEGWPLPESLLNSVHCQCGASWTFKDGALDYKPPKKQKEWVGLTDDERDEIREQAHYKFDDISNAIEAKLKEKNNG